MRIIVDNGAYTLRNMGDVAMLQVALRRLRLQHPDAECRVLTTRPDLLGRYCPGTLPLAVASRDAAYDPARPAGSARREAWRRFKRRCGLYPRQGREFLQALAGADLVVVAGGGFLNDLNPLQTRAVLRMLADAGARGQTTALVSQGLGPLENPELVGLLADACRAGARVGLREARRGPEILARAGVGREQYRVTGDDALELAWERPATPGGQAIGFSVRQTDYAGVQDPHLEAVRRVLERLLQRHHTRLVALPISFNSFEDDCRTIARVTGWEPPADPLDDPATIIQAAGTCRLVVTGTYHAAVFALAQGVPCVCFHASPYYRDKMEGLADQFPVGCEFVDLGETGAEVRLEDAATRLWSQAGELRAALKARAGEQVTAGQRFYQDLL
ncbi:MAG TPA: polysaccharide pyruvyl transferase family protein [Candidatus Paceibacterota bacterium]|nr:polysaccharide pyruvyl transferase family protein [Candidatus Paceibacterota bacterium]